MLYRKHFISLGLEQLIIFKMSLLRFNDYERNYPFSFQNSRQTLSFPAPTHSATDSLEMCFPANRA